MFDASGTLVSSFPFVLDVAGADIIRKYGSRRPSEAFSVEALDTRLFVALLAVAQRLLVALLTVSMSSLGLLLTAQPLFLGLRKMFSISSRVFPFVSGIRKSMKTKQQVTTPAKTKKSPESPMAPTMWGEMKLSESEESPSTAATRPVNVERELEGSRTPRSSPATLT